MCLCVLVNKNSFHSDTIESKLSICSLFFLLVLLNIVWCFLAEGRAKKGGCFWLELFFYHSTSEGVVKNILLVFLSVFFGFISQGNATTISYIEDSLSGYQNTHEFYVQGNEVFSAYFTEFEYSTVPDTLFYLFDSTMRLVSWDDDSGGNFTSKITEEYLTPGKYYLTISHYNFWPLDEEGVMFQLPAYVAGGYELDQFYEQHPVSTLSGTLVDWAFLGYGECDLTSYTLALEGATPLPEPATMLLFGTGLAGLVSSRLRKKKH